MNNTVSVISFFTCYKIRMVLYSRLFGYQCFKCQLESIVGFGVYHFFAFIGLIPEVICLYSSIVLLLNGSDGSDGNHFMTYLDVTIIFAINIILALVSSKKEINFFE